MEKLGIQTVPFLTQLISFLIIWWVLKKYLFTKVLANLDKRHQIVQKSLDDAQKIQQRLEKVEQEVDKKLSQASQEAQQIIDAAKQEAQAVKQEIKHQAETEANKLLEQAQVRLKQQEEELYRQVRSEMAVIAKEVIEKVLTASLGKKEAEKITQKAVSQVKQVIVN